MRWVAGLLAAAAVVLQLAGPRAVALLRYERGEDWWRYATGHLVHASWGHLALNVAGAALVVALFRRRLSVVALLASAGGVSAGLYFCSPHVAWYVGFSGALHGLFAYGAVRSVRAGRSAWLLGLVALTAKIAFEQWRGALPGVEAVAESAVIVDAHLYGVFAGLSAGALPWPRPTGPNGR